jgi:hypothetical protein
VGIPLDLEELGPQLLPGAGEEVQQRTKQARRRDALRFTGVVLAEAFPLFLAVMVALVSALAARRGIRLPGDTPTEQVAGIVWFAFATGATSMAVIEAAKRLFGLRGLYQHRQVRMWLIDRSPSEPAGRNAYQQLLAALGVVAPGSGSRELLRRHHLRRLFNLPIEQVAGQVRSAADLAIVNPRGYGYLLVALAGTYDIETGPEGSDADAESSVELQLAHAVNSGVDALQIAVGEGWRRYVRSTAVLVSGLLGLALARFADLDPSAIGAYVLAALLLGGFLAWFLRDVTAVVERWRR